MTQSQRHWTTHSIWKIYSFPKLGRIRNTHPRDKTQYEMSAEDRVFWGPDRHSTWEKSLASRWIGSILALVINRRHILWETWEIPLINWTVTYLLHLPPKGSTSTAQPPTLVGAAASLQRVLLTKLESSEHTQQGMLDGTSRPSQHQFRTMIMKMLWKVVVQPEADKIYSFKACPRPVPNIFEKNDFASPTTASNDDNRTSHAPVRMWISPPKRMNRHSSTPDLGRREVAAQL